MGHTCTETHFRLCSVEASIESWDHSILFGVAFDPGHSYNQSPSNTEVAFIASFNSLRTGLSSAPVQFPWKQSSKRSRCSADLRTMQTNPVPCLGSPLLLLDQIGHPGHRNICIAIEGLSAFKRKQCTI